MRLFDKKYFRFLFFLLLIFLSILFYRTFYSDLSIFLIIINIIIALKLLFRWNTKFLIFLIITSLIYLLLYLLLPSEFCGNPYRYSGSYDSRKNTKNYTSYCTCEGIKISISSTESRCIGKRLSCYQGYPDIMFHTSYNKVSCESW